MKLFGTKEKEKYDKKSYTNEENDVAENANCCLFLQKPNYSNENNKSWGIQFIEIISTWTHGYKNTSYHKVMGVLTNAKSSKCPLFEQSYTSKVKSLKDLFKRI